MAVELLQRGAQERWQLWRCFAGGGLGLGLALAGAGGFDIGVGIVRDGGRHLAALGALAFARQQVLAVLVEVAQHRLCYLLGAVVDWQEGDLDQPGLDGVDQAEITDQPRKVAVGRPARARQVVGRGRQVVDRAHLPAPGGGAQAAVPDGGAFVLGGAVLFVGVAALGAGPVAVVGLVVEHQQAAAGLEAGQQPAQHHGLVFAGLDLAAVGAELAVQRAFFVAGDQPRLEAVEVADRQSGIEPSHQAGVGRWHQLALAVVVVGLVVEGGLGVVAQHPQPITDGDAGRHQQEVVGVLGVVAVLAAVEVVVQHQAGHDHGLAGACGHLEGNAGQREFRVLHAGLRGAKLVQHVGARVALVGHFIEPDGSLHGLALREEQTLMAGALRVLEPVGQQLTRDAAGDSGVAAAPPSAELVAQKVDQVIAVVRRQVVDVVEALLRCRCEVTERHLWCVGREDAATCPPVSVVEVAVGRGGVMEKRLVVRPIQDRAGGGFGGLGRLAHKALMRTAAPGARPAPCSWPGSWPTGAACRARAGPGPG